MFTLSGKMDPRVKWQKNVFRFAMVFACTAVSWVGAADLDKFVAFIGCFAWYVFMATLSFAKWFSFEFFSVPLCYVYPAMLHYKAISRTRTQKVADIALIIFGLAAAVYTTIQTTKVCSFFPIDALVLFQLKIFGDS